MPILTKLRSTQGWSGLACLLVLLVVCCQSASAADPSRDLWQLVPQDVGFAVEVRDLSTQARRFLVSPLFQRLQRHSAWQNFLRSAEINELKNLEQSVVEVTRQPLVEWLEKLVGYDALLAVTPQSGGTPRFVLLMKLKRPSDLPEILSAWTKLEPRTETRLDYQGQAYFRRVKSDVPDEPLFYASIDDILVVSDKAESLSPVFDLARDPQRSAIDRTPGFQQLARTLHPAAALRVLIQPGAWKEARPGDEGSTDVVERFIYKAWNRCQIIGVGIRLESGVVTEVVVKADDLAQQSFWVKLVAKSAGNPAFLERVPSTAILAFAGRHDVANVAEAAIAMIPKERIKKWKSTRQIVSGFLLGSDLLADILPALPADFGGYIVPRTELLLKAAPVDGLLAVALPALEAAGDPASEKSEPAKSGKPSVRAAIDNGLRSALSLLAAVNNATSDSEATIESVVEAGSEVHWLDGLGTVRPAYAIAPDYLLIASSPRLIRDFLTQSPATTWGSDDRLKQSRTAAFPDASQLLALNGQSAAAFIREHHEFLIKQVATFHRLKPDEATKRLDRILEWLQLSDRVVIAATLQPDHIKLVLLLDVIDHAAPSDQAK